MLPAGPLDHSAPFRNVELPLELGSYICQLSLTREMLGILDAETWDFSAVFTDPHAVVRLALGLPFGLHGDALPLRAVPG